jgi:CO/xanthine dehydrogenase FAD-binding subunit
VLPDDINAATVPAAADARRDRSHGHRPRQLRRRGSIYSWLAAITEIELDVETGVIDVIDLVAVTDCGTVIHPRSLGGQCYGGIIQGMGMAMSQRWVFDPQYGVPFANRLYTAGRRRSWTSRRYEWDAVGIPDPTARRREGHRRAVRGRGVGDDDHRDRGRHGRPLPLQDAAHTGHDPRRARGTSASVWSTRPARRLGRPRNGHDQRHDSGVRPLAADVEEDAVALLSEHGSQAWVLAGGLDTFDWLKDRIKRPRVVVDLGGVAEMRGIRELQGGIEIGAMTTLTEIVNAPADPRASTRCSHGRGAVATPQIRNQGTLGGNVSQDTRCWYYRSGWPCYRAGGNTCYASTRRGAMNREHAIMGRNRCVAVNPSDTAPALVALDAKMIVENRRRPSTYDAEDFFIGPSIDITRMTVMKPGRPAHPGLPAAVLGQLAVLLREGPGPWLVGLPARERGGRVPDVRQHHRAGANRGERRGAVPGATRGGRAARRRHDG